MNHPDDVLAGLVLGAVTASWSFRFLVVMPFYHEIGSPPWKATPRWVEEEEREWAAEEEEMVRMCPWKRRRGRRRIRYESAEAEEEGKPQASATVAADTSTEVGFFSRCSLRGFGTLAMMVLMLFCFKA